MLHALLIALVLIASTTALAAATTKPGDLQKQLLDAPLTINGRSEHPTVYLTRADIDLAKKNREQFAWAKAAADKILHDADEWMNKSDEDIRKLVPKPGACFAYGFSGCPICGGKIGGWWGTDGACTLDDPGHVKCDKGHRLPDDDHPDTGEGWTDKSGKKYYFVGEYNAFVIDTLLTSALKPLCNAYALTGDMKYAQKAAMILDELARIYPTCDKGSWDYPSTPPSGRFNRPWYQVARTLISYTNFYDILMMGDALSSPSSVAGKTKRENIEQNMLLNGARYCYEQSIEHPSLTNGQADYIRGAMVVGVAMGIPEYINWTVDGPYSIRNMIENNIDRDGQYYETSSLYSHHAQYLYMDMAEILKNYTDAAHPDGIHLADNPKFRALFTLPSARVQVLGRLPRLGDDAPDLGTKVVEPLVPPDDLNDLEHLRALTAQPEQKQQLAELLDLATGRNLEASRAKSKESDWLLFHAEPVDAHPNARFDVIHPLTGKELTASDLISQRGLAILRSGEGPNSRAVTLRAGPTLNHGHLDELNLNIYACGQQLNYDLGYGLGSTHTQVGWAHQTASHTTVLVNEESQLQSGHAGGTIEKFLALPGIQFVQANDRNCYNGERVSSYRRAVALVDVSPQESYVLDLFRVVGAKTSDYVFHGRGTNVVFNGVTLSGPRKGSLAGENIDWSPQIGVDGDVKSMPNKPYWNPPPGNGLGFLHAPRAGETSDPWSATWTVDEKNPAHLRLWAVPILGNMQVRSAEAPGITPQMPRATYVLARQVAEGYPEGHTYSAVIEPFGNTAVIKQVGPPGGPYTPPALRIELADGRIDFVRYELPDYQEFLHVRVRDSEVEALTYLGGRFTKFGDLTIQLPQDAYCGSIDRIDLEKNILYTKGTLPEGEKLRGEFVSIGNDNYTHRSSYRIESVSRAGDETAIHLAPTTFIIGRAHLDRSPPDEKTLPNVVPLEYAKSVGGKASGFFDGKTIIAPNTHAKTTIRSIEGGQRITVASSAGFKAGDDAIIYDVQPGDDFNIPCWVQIKRDANGKWVTTGNVDAKVEGLPK